MYLQGGAGEKTVISLSASTLSSEVLQTDQEGERSPEGIEVIHFLERRLGGAQLGDVFPGGPAGVAVEHRSEGREEVLGYFALLRDRVVEGRVHTVEGPPPDRVRQHLDG